jgi:long-chain fatty acid transport protein
VQASGYALREQSASALGNAFAGATAGAEDVSYMFFNPAGLTRQSGSQIIGIGNLIMPQLKIHDARASTGGAPIGGNEGGRDAGEDALVPDFYGLLDLQQSFGLEQNVKLGLGVNEPFGVETDYRDGWTGRYYALHSKIMAVNVNPVMAWEVVEGLSVAAGLQMQYMEARLTNAIDFGSIVWRGLPALRRPSDRFRLHPRIYGERIDRSVGEPAGEPVPRQLRGTRKRRSRHSGFAGTLGFLKPF